MARKLLRLCGRFTPARKHALPASLHHRRLRYELLESRVLLSSGVTNLSFRTGDQLNSQILDDIHAGNLVYLRADASGMEGQKITVELWEDNGVGDYKVLTTPITINAEGFGTAAWLATWQATDMAPFNRYYLFYDVPWSTSNLYSGDPNTDHFQVSASVDNKIEGAAYDLNNPIQTTPVVLKRFGSDSIDPNLDTWVVIHGRTSSAAESYIFDLAKTLSDRVEQVLTLDWKRGADTRDFSGERWIVPVAKWASDVLHDYGLSGSRLNLVGHSWGAVVASELSAAFPGGVQRLVALDPAEDAWPPLGAAYDTGTANFNAHSGYSWAFYSQGPYWNSVSWNPGNERTPTTADEAIVVMQTTHDGVVRLFSYMLGQPEQAISGVFSLDRLVKGRGGPWSENRYNDDGDPGAGPNYGYEAVITAETVGISPRPVRLNYIDNKNKPAVLFEKTADTTPPVVALYGLSSAESSPTKLGGSQSLSVTARAVDPESKIEAGESYRFYAQTKSLAGWGNRWFLGSSSGTDKKDLGRMPEGLHRVWVEVKNGTGLSGQSPYGFVYVPTSTPPPSADPSPFSAAARDDHSNLFGPSDTTITASAQVPGQIERAEDHDWFRYTATRNGSIVVDVMPLDNRLQPHLRFHWDNKILIRQDIGGGAGTAAKVSYAGAEAGRTYYIDVSGVGGTVGGYTVRVTQPSQVPPDPAEYRPSPSEAADDYPNTKSSAIPVALDDEGRTTISGRIQPVGDEDWTTFTARRTGLLLIEADTPNSSLDTLLRLFNSGVLVAQDHSRIERRVNAGETYWLDVRAGSENGPGDIKPGEDPTGKYVIRITQPRDEDQSGSSGTDTTPGPLPGWGGVRGVQINLSNGNGSSRGAIDDPAETDWFQINGAHDGNMQILVVANNSEVVPFVTAFRSNGGGIDSDTAEFDREAKVGFHIAQNEVICVAVKSHGGRSTGGYTITVTQPSSLPNDDLPDFGETPRELRVPNDITTGGSGFLYARIETPDDNDWIRIPVLGSGYLHVQVTTNDGGLVPMLELNRDGSSGGWFDSDDGRDGLANIAFLPSGVSYVWAKVSGLDGTQGAYAITTWRSQNLDDDHPNSGGPFVAPHTLAAHGYVVIQGRIDSPRDQDSFRVVMAQPGPVAVAVIPLTEGLKPFMKDSWDVPDSHGDTQNTTGTGSGDRVLDIVDSAVTFVDINVTSDESNSLTPIGDYVIWVWQPVGVTPTNKDNDPDTAGIESTSLLLDGSGNGSLPGYPNGTGQPALNSPGDKDVFRVEAAAARPITFTVTGQDTFLRIYDASAKAIATDHGSGTGGASQVTVEAERGQLFYIEVSAFNGTDQGPYTVNVSQPTDDYPDAPTYPPTASQPAITTIEGFTATIVTATGLDEPVGLAVAPSAFGSYAGDLFVANRQTKSPSDPDFITRIDITNGQNLGVSSRFVDVGPSDPHGVTFDASGTSLFVNTNSNTARDGRGRVLTISPSGDVSVYSNVGADSPGGALQFDDSGAYGGDLYIGVTGYSDFIGRIEGPGANASVFADFGSPPVDSISSPVDIAFGHGGAFGTAMYVTLAVVDANAIAPGIYRVQSDGSTERFVTSRETGLFASNPSGLALSEGGPFGEYMYVGRGNNVIRVAGDGTASVFATGFSGVTDVAFSNDGVVLYVLDGGANSVIRIGEGEVAGNPEVELNVNGFGEASGQIEDTLVGDRDVFHVYSDRRSQFTINVSTIDNTLDTFLRVYDSLGNLVAIDDDGGDGRNSQATFTAFMGETYQIEVAGYNDNSVGSYRVTVQQADLPEAVRVGTYDDFNDNLIDAEKWTSSASGSARVREEGRRIQLLADGANATSDNNVASLQSLIALRENIEFDVTPRLGRDQNFGYVEMASGSAFIRLRFGSDGAGGVQLTVENAGYVELENAGSMAVSEGVAAHVAFRNTSDGIGVYVNGIRRARFEGSLRPDSVLRAHAESAQSASRLQLMPYDDFNDNSINTAKWNVSGGVRESSERLYLYATEGSQARQQNATTQGKPGGDNIHGARWTMSYLDNEADGMDHWSEITNGTDYIRFFYKSTGPTILVQLGGTYGSGEVAHPVTRGAVVEVKEESGDITIRIGGELKYTIRGKQLSANSYFRAFAQYNGGNPSGYGDKRMTVDDLSFYQIVTTPDDERLAELIVDNVEATYRPRYDWVSSLYDDFQDGQLDHSKWNAAGTVEEQDGVLRLPLFRDHQPVSGFISTAGMPGGMNLRGFSANVNRRSGPITVGAVPGHEFDTWARMRLTNGQDWIEVGWNLKNNSFKVETRGFYGSRTEEFPVSEGIVDGGFGVREFNGNIEVLHDGQVKLTVPGKTVRAGSFFTFESNGSPPNGGTPYDPPTDFEVMIDNLTFYVDPVPPNFKPAPALTKESDSGDSDADHVTNRLSLDFEWAVGTDGTRYQWREGELQEDGSIVYGTWSPPQSGTTAHVELPHGSIHVFSVRPIDAAGMVGEASARAFVVDTNPPTLQSAEAIAGIHPRLELQFSESVYGEPSDLTVLDGNGNPIVPVTIEGWGTPELTVEFVGPIWSGSATVRLNGTQSVKDIAGNRLDGNDDGTAGGDAVRAVTFLVNYWTNPVNACDVNSENSVTPLDALELINWINSHPGQTQLPGTQSTPPKFFDTSGDGMITAQDVIVVINYINKRIADAEGEGTTWHAWPIVPEGRALANDFDNVTLANQAVSPARSRHKSAEFWSASQDAAVPTVSACLSARLAAVDTRTRSDELDLAIQDIAGHIARVWELIP